MSPLTQQRMKSIQELDKEAEETYERLLRNRYQMANNRAASIAVSSPSQHKNYSANSSNSTISKKTPYYMHFKKLAKEDEEEAKQPEVVFRNQQQQQQSDASAELGGVEYEDSLKRFRDKHFSSNYKSNSLVLSNNNKSNVNNYLNRKYSSQIEPVSETREDDKSEDLLREQSSQPIATSEF